MNKSESKIKVAIIYWGLTRSLKYTLPSIRSNIYEPLINNNIDFDVFLHTFKLMKDYSNPRSNEVIKHSEIDNKEYRLLNQRLL